MVVKLPAYQGPVMGEVPASGSDLSVRRSDQVSASGACDNLIGASGAFQRSTCLSQQGVKDLIAGRPAASSEHAKAKMRGVARIVERCWMKLSV